MIFFLLIQSALTPYDLERQVLWKSVMGSYLFPAVRFEPGTAGYEARTLRLCYAVTAGVYEHLKRCHKFFQSPSSYFNRTSKASNFRPQFIQIALDQQLFNEHFNLILWSVINVIGFRQMWSRVNYFYVKLLPSETCVGCKTSHKSIGDLLRTEVRFILSILMNWAQILKLKILHFMSSPTCVKWNHFFRSQSALIKHVLSEAAQLGIHFLSRKNSNAAPPRGTCLRKHNLEMV